jgi:replicative DNA helicase
MTAPEEIAGTPPHNIEVEQGLLGAILINNEAFYRVSDFLDAKHFFEPIHGRIFEVIATLIQSGKTATPVTLKTYLPGDLDIAGLSLNQYLARLAAEATTIINAIDYGVTVRDLALRRELIGLGENIVNAARDAAVEQTPLALIEDAERSLYRLCETSRYGGGFITFDEAMCAAVDMAAHAYQRDGNLSGSPTGLADLDGRMGGMQPSDLIILAGRPGMGKTALATNIARYVARNWKGEVGADGRIKTITGGIVGFFSLEMSAEQLATRIIAEQAGIPSSQIRRGAFDEAQFYAIRDATEQLARMPLHIDQAGGLSIAQIAARARRLKRQKGLDLMVVDYLQLMQSSRRYGNRVEEITEITSGLKTLAKELNIPILALAQLSRKVEERDNKRPRLADLRESGSIEQDADVVLFLFREEYYHEMNKPPESDCEAFTQWLVEAEKLFGKAELILAKQRHGPTGTIALHFDAALTRFSNLAATFDTLPDVGRSAVDNARAY